MSTSYLVVSGFFLLTSFSQDKQVILGFWVQNTCPQLSLWMFSVLRLLLIVSPPRKFHERFNF